MDFTKGPIIGPLLKFSMPILFALFLQALYGAVDLMVVGKFALAQDVSGVAVGSQIIGQLAALMNAPEEAFEQTSRYIAICGAGSLMIVAYNVLGSIMRGLGDSNTPLITVAIASVCNIAGDLLRSASSFRSSY